jgi:OOP family OmpA-OmpF porin
MKKSTLGLALLGALCASHAVSAQDFDNRWYVSGSLGYLWADGDRNVDDDYLWGVGVGKRVSPNFSVELQYDAATLETVLNGLDWSLQSLQVIGRYHFMGEDRTWNPYLAFGGGVQKHSEEYRYVEPGIDQVNERNGEDFIGTLGVGFESDRRKRVDYRFEAGLRYDNDQFEEDDAGQANEYGSYLDYYATASLLVKIGDLPVPVVAAATCDTMDSDGDGVNDCNDKCPGSAAGQTVGADGCPVKLTIDLKGVNFDFDKDTLRPDAVVILDEAVAVLAKYPELRVEVAGHTDLCGDEAYNQGLSQRRAKVAYDYLTSKGVDPARMVGPNGYGESRPLESTEQTSPACKNEANRRTELDVQN